MQRSACLAVLLGALIACAPEEQPARTQPPPATTTPRESLRAVAARVPVTPAPPREAKTIDGVHCIVLAPGFGRAKPSLRQQALLAISYIAYDERGAFKSETPVTVQELDGVGKEWRGVLSDMVAGEKRRVWVPEGNRFRIWDLELQSIGRSR